VQASPPVGQSGPRACWKAAARETLRATRASRMDADLLNMVGGVELVRGGLERFDEV